MEINEALTLFSLNEEYTNTHLMESFKEKIELINNRLKDTDVESIILEITNELSDLSNAFELLINNSINSRSDQPLIIFTDASVRQDMEIAAFSIIAKNLGQNFILPNDVIDKYNIQAETGSSSDLCILSGVIANFDVNATEIIALMAALDIFQYAVFESGQSIICYTDSLIAKKVIEDERMPPRTAIYKNLRNKFRETIYDNSLHVTVKKVKAHAGIEMNEIADQVAKDRLTNELNS